MSFRDRPNYFQNCYQDHLQVTLGSISFSFMKTEPMSLFAEMVAYAAESYQAGDDLVEVAAFLREQDIDPAVFNAESRDVLVEKMQAACDEARPRDCAHCDGCGRGDVWYDKWAERESQECVECHGTGEAPYMHVEWSVQVDAHVAGSDMAAE